MAVCKELDLTNVFHTRGGREVRDGGGIKPDIVARADSLPSLIYDVIDSDQLFDYATQYAQQHPSIAPACNFQLSDEDYNDFVQLVLKSDFKANRRSEEVLKVLRDAARMEGCLDEAKAEFDALEQKLKGNLETDLLRHREDVRPYIEDEIVSRYYYQRGRSEHLLRNDKVFDRAVELLNDEEAYRKILRP